MDYSKLCETYLGLEETTKRLEKTEILSKLLKNTSVEELKEIIYLIKGRVFPDWDERKLGMSSKLILKSISNASGASKEKIERLWKKIGDLGKVAEELMKDKKQRTLHNKKLTAKKVFDNIKKLPELTGEGTVSRKVNLIAELLSNATPVEARFIVRTVLEELRVGVASGVIRDSIAKAFNIEVKDVERAFELLNDYGEVAEKAKSGKRSLRSVSINVGKPIKVMLPIRVNLIEDAFKALGKTVQCEIKLDGFRVQIHKKGEDISLFTRRLENVTNQFKEILPILKKNVKGDSYILDTELIGFNPKTKKYLPFQSISHRIRRKYDIEKMAKSLPVEINIFDVMYYNGKNLFDKTLKERRKILEKIVNEERRKIVLTEKLITDNKKSIEKFYKESLNEGYEGVIFKKIDSEYKPGRYVKGWIKLKPIMETLDLVIIGGVWGEGKRATWLSSFALGCRKGNKFLEIGKIGTGIKEKSEGVTFKQLTKELKPYIEETKGRTVKIKPKLIIEIAYEEIQKSPTYSSGYALRFPRLLRLRDDLSIKDCDDIERVRKFYLAQRKISEEKK
ncbi:DNA ligase [archaeon]|nr:DNA ligase [archaeon]